MSDTGRRMRRPSARPCLHSSEALREARWESSISPDQARAARSAQHEIATITHLCCYDDHDFLFVIVCSVFAGCAHNRAVVADNVVNALAGHAEELERLGCQACAHAERSAAGGNTPPACGRRLRARRALRRGGVDLEAAERLLNR